jgi:hypothetical protein
MPDPTCPFWLDWDHDRNGANIGTESRYGNYLSSRTSWFAEIDYEEPASAFAATAWRIATGPVMSPPLVHRHERILGVTLQRSRWDGGMLAAVRLATRRPEALADARTPLNRWYRGWGDNGGFLRGDFDGPSEEDLTKGAYLLAETQVLWQLPADALPAISEVPTDPAEIFRLAVACVEALVAGLNREVGPLLERLER